MFAPPKSRAQSPLRPLRPSRASSSRASSPQPAHRQQQIPVPKTQQPTRNTCSWQPYRSESDRRPYGPQIPHASHNARQINPSPRSFTQTHSTSATLDDIMSSANLAPSSLRSYLLSFGVFPDTYRPLIWRFLLGLPGNRAAYDAFQAQGIHPSQAQFRSRFPIKSPALADATHKVVSALAHWTPLFAGNVDYLPHLVFPLVKVMHRDPLSALELSATVVFNYCQKWWEYFPNPPLDCLEFVDNVLARFDPALHAHLHGKASSPAHVYAWPAMQGLLSESLHRDAWVRVWDHVVTMTMVGPFLTKPVKSSTKSKFAKPRNTSVVLDADENLPPPVYFTLALVAYLRHFRTPIMHLTSPAHIRDWTTTARPCSPAAITDLMHAMATDMLQADLPMRYAAPASTAHDATLQDQMAHVALDTSPPTPGELAHAARGLFSSYQRLPRPTHTTPNAGAATWSTSYPPLTHFPHAILHYATTLHARLCADEAATLRARRALRDLHALRADLDRDTHRWQSAGARSRDAMRDWWAHVLSAEAESWERARAARAEVRGAQMQAMRGVARAREAWVREKEEREEREREVVRGVVARARLVGELRRRDAREEDEVDELRHEWETRWREVKREREREAQVERERVAKTVEVVSKVVAGKEDDWVGYSGEAARGGMQAQGQVSFAEDPLRGAAPIGTRKFPWEEVLELKDRQAHTASSPAR